MVTRTVAAAFAALCLSAAPAVQGLEVVMDGETVSVDKKGASADTPAESSHPEPVFGPTEYMKYLSNEGVELDGVEIAIDTEGGLSLVASRKLRSGEVVIEIPSTAFISATTGLSDNKKDEVKKWFSSLSEMDSTVVEGGDREVNLALRLMVQAGVTHDLMVRTPPLSGLNATSEKIISCMYSDLKAHIESLRLKLDSFSSAAHRVGLGAEQEASRALLYSLQNGAALPVSQDYVIFPALELLRPSHRGHIHPDKLYDTQDKEIRYDPASGKPAPRIGKATFKVVRETQKGEELTKGMTLGMFRSAALFGEVDDDISGLPLEITWEALSDAAKTTLRKHNCGKSGVAMVTMDGGFSDALEVCINIVAAYQMTKDDSEKQEEVASLPFSSPAELDSNIRLGGFELLLHLFEEHLKKLPSDKACYDAKKFSVPILASLNSKIRDCLEKATEKLKKRAEKHLDAMEGEEKKAGDSEADQQEL
eukprot:TRINITY_DN31728_c0_g1_i1.p1 TRINITY_DN31728_c0_g1~~TRINITY_DN31728_c0_g1_i1.p1  ORF type:complete len:489 (+),score=226.62 TRINITY_DN31728_c0_g1_i1:31-1467(+)